MKIKVLEVGAHDATVYFNDVIQTLCVEADDVDNYIIRYQTDKNGKPILDENGYFIDLYEIVYGEVKIVLTEQSIKDRIRFGLEV